MKKISVIVPCYNATSYMHKCFESLINQTMFNDLDIIVVDDKSTDDTKKEIEKYIKKYPENIRGLFLKKNGGLGNVRNVALEEVKTDYVYYIDSDDYIEPDTLEECYKKITKDKSDIVEFDFVWEFPNKKRYDYRVNYKNSKQMLKELRVLAWNKLYKTSFVRKTKAIFAVGLRYEDILFAYQYIPFEPKVSYINKVFYHYVQRSNSISNNQNEKVREIYDVLKEVYNYYVSNKLLKKYHDELEYNFIRILLGSSYKRAVNIKNKAIRKRILEEGWTFLNDKFPDWKKNKYLNEGGKKNLYFKLMNKFLYDINGIWFRK